MEEQIRRMTLVIRPVCVGIILLALLGTIGMLLTWTASAETATKEEIDAAVKFYDGVRTEPDKQKAYCDVKQAIGMMASDPKKFAEAKQKAAAATNKLGPDFATAQNLPSRLDMASADTKRYLSARQALDKTCS